MRHELTTEQARQIVSLHDRHPSADVVVHRRPWGVVVEARRDGSALELLQADYYGHCASEQPLSEAA
jgi:hypothetical protein